MTEDQRRESSRAASLRWKHRNLERCREADRKRSRDHREREAIRHASYRASNREKFRDYRKNYAARLKADPDRLAKHRDHHRDYLLQRRYGISAQEFDLLRLQQKGCCAGCGEASIRLVVDHDHSTGQNRGLLCNACNKTLGHVEDDAARLITLASRYLPWCDSLVAGLEERVSPKKYRSALSPELRKLLTERYGDGCMVCSNAKRLCVDHDHTTRLVRGLLCSGCNSALGFSKESADRLLALSRYLAHWKDRS